MICFSRRTSATNCLYLPTCSNPRPDTDPFDHCLVAPRHAQWDITLDSTRTAVRGLRPSSATRDAPPWLLRALIHAESMCVDSDTAAGTPSSPVMLHLLRALIQRASRGDIHGEQSLEDMRLHHKKGDGTAMAHYRPLVVGTLFRRVLDRAVAVEVSRLLQPHESVAQTGFTPGRSHHDMVYVTHTATSAAATPHPTCPTAHYRDLPSIKARLDHPRTHEPCTVATLDISNAYPSIDMNTLWHILVARGLDTPATRLMLMCMRGTRVSIKFGRDPRGTTPQRVYRGTSQGSPYSPIAWRAYLLGLPTRMPGVQALIYADDIALLATTQRRLSTAMHTITPVLTERGLALSGPKSKVAHAGPPPFQPRTCPVPPLGHTPVLDHTSPDPTPLTLLGHNLVLGDQSHHVALRLRTAQRRLYAAARNVRGMALTALADATTAATIAQVYFLPVFDQGVSTPELHRDHYPPLMRVWEQAVREAAWVTPIGKGQFSHATREGIRAALGLLPGRPIQRLHKIRQLARALRYPRGSPMRDALMVEWRLSHNDWCIRQRKRRDWMTRPHHMNGDQWLACKWTYAGIRWGAKCDVLAALDDIQPHSPQHWRQRVRAAWDRMDTHVLTTGETNDDIDLIHKDMQYMEYSYALWIRHQRNHNLTHHNSLVEVVPLLSLLGLGAPVPAADGPRGLATSLRLAVAAGGARALVGYREYTNIPRDDLTTCKLCHGAVWKRRWLEHLATNCLHPRLVHERGVAARGVVAAAGRGGTALTWCDTDGATPPDVMYESRLWLQVWTGDETHIAPSPWTADTPCELTPAQSQEPPVGPASPLCRWSVVWMALVWGLPVPGGVIPDYNPGGCRAEAARPDARRSSRGSPARRRAIMLATAGLVVAAAEEMAAAYDNEYIGVLKEFLEEWQRRQPRPGPGPPP